MSPSHRQLTGRHAHYWQAAVHVNHGKQKTNYGPNNDNSGVDMWWVRGSV